MEYLYLYIEITSCLKHKPDPESKIMFKQQELKMYTYKLELLLTYQDMKSVYRDKQSTAKYRPSNIPVHLVTREKCIFILILVICHVHIKY